MSTTELDYNYGMFTNAGDAAVYGVVATASVLDLTWDEVVRALSMLSRQPGFGEAMDTAVREAVYIDLFGE